jgi:hypothetical protein
MNAPQQAILDYASPRPRGKVRLPARSELAVRIDADSVEVIERLTGKLGAFGAIAFAAAMFVLMGAMGAAEAPKRDSLPQSVFVATFIAGGCVVMAMVINNTWRRTILSANADGIRLRFFAPLSGTRRYHWDADTIEALRVEPKNLRGPTAIDLARSGALAEIQIHPTGGAVAHLFTDHEAFHLVPIAEALLRVIAHPTVTKKN